MSQEQKRMFLVSKTMFCKALLKVFEGSPMDVEYWNRNIWEWVKLPGYC